MGCADAAQVPREDLGVDAADSGAHEGHLAVELHDVLGRQDDPDAVADLGVVPLLIRSTRQPNCWARFS